MIFLRKPFRAQEIYDLLTAHLGVRFVYEDEQPAVGKQTPEIRKETLTPEALAVLPEALRMKLEHAATIGDLGPMMGLIEEVRGFDSALSPIRSPPW